jgi:multiple sugar transport system permease protein
MSVQTLSVAGRSPAAQATTRRLSWRRRRAGGAVLLGLVLYSCFALAPFAWIVLMAFKQSADIIAYPPLFVDFVPTLGNFGTILHLPDFLQPFRNTLIVTIGSVSVSMLLGLPAAYALAKMRFRGRENIAFSIISLRFAPELFVILPLFILYRSLGLNNTFGGLVLAYQLVTFPLIVWMMRSFYEEIPKEIDEAVAVDGGTRWTAFVVSTRIAISGVAASAMLAFIFAWNTYALPLVLAGRDTQVITGAILNFMKFADVEWGPMAAGTVFSIIPSLLFTILLAGRLVAGMTAGAVKG